MGRSYFLISILLLACVGFLGFKLYGVLAKPFVLATMAETPKTAAVKGESKEQTVQQPKVNDPAISLAIVQKDLFRPSRAEPKKEDIAKVQPQTPPPRLVGTLITESRTEAFLEDSVTKSVKPYRIKETIGDFTVVDIKDNRVALRRGNEQVAIDIPLAGPNPLGVGSPPPRPSQPVGQVPTTSPAPGGQQGISQVPQGTAMPAPKVAPGQPPAGQTGIFGPLGNRTRRPSEVPRRPTINQGAGQ
jgi:hypothetical protein